MKYLVDVAHPEAKKIKVVQDNLNTHVKASLYKQGKRILFEQAIFFPEKAIFFPQRVKSNT